MILLTGSLWFKSWQIYLRWRERRNPCPFPAPSEAAAVDTPLPLLLPWVLSQVTSTQWSGMGHWLPSTDQYAASSSQSGTWLYGGVILSLQLTLTFSFFFFFFFLTLQEPSNKRVKPLSRVTSLANLIPPVKATPLKRFSQTLQVRRPRWTHVCRKPCYVGGDIGALTNPPLAYFNRRESR